MSHSQELEDKGRLEDKGSGVASRGHSPNTEHAEAQACVGLWGQSSGQDTHQPHLGAGLSRGQNTPDK